MFIPKIVGAKVPDQSGTICFIQLKFSLCSLGYNPYIVIINIETYSFWKKKWKVNKNKILSSILK